ncbi:hypothetical protein [Acidiferrobacter sp.]|jgi:hypothetical protein|uniref:hypothetical protein n=1 Tax=Acidiferrobacter sp. TaxID=1872107 RepID=UPI002601EFE1|nr:hypothetical protein [Acidiferrobacter sp.]
MDRLIEWRDREVWLVSGGPPAVYYLVDRAAGGVLINAPRFDQTTYEALRRHADPRFVFLPSRFGARDIRAWREAGLRVLVSAQEEGVMDADLRIDAQQKLTRTIDFLPLPGRTRGTCGLRLKNLPGAVFVGPALASGGSGWPELVPEPDDLSYEGRLIGTVGLGGEVFDYLFTDSFVPGHTRFGPGARDALRAHIERLLA